MQNAKIGFYDKGARLRLLSAFQNMSGKITQLKQDVDAN